MNKIEHINEANRIAKSINRCYKNDVKKERKLLVLAHLKKACQLKK